MMARDYAAIPDSLAKQMNTIEELDFYGPSHLETSPPA